MEATLPHIGNFIREGETEITETFHGARMMRSGQTVNECVSMSFDPLTLNCVVCKSGHSILNNGGPVAICFSDQNFLPHLANREGGTCRGVLRLEDASLTDLSAIALEVLERHTLVPGSVVLIGSASHLFKSSVSEYARDWVNTVGKLSAKWSSVNICPLIPVIRDVCPGSLARDIEMLSIWFSKVYSGSIRGMLDSWLAVNAQVHTKSLGGMVMESGDFIKIPLPPTINSPGTQTHFFRFSSSCPVLLSGCDRKTALELASILLKTLQRDFSVCYNPEITLPREPVAVVEVAKAKHLVCVGASNMRNTVPYLRAMGYTVTDLSRAGWLATEDNIAAVIKSLSELSLEPGFAVVLDLLGNCSYRYIQFDGTQALPRRDATGYHMEGDIATCNEDIYRRIIKSLSPILLSAQNADKIIMPPLPRYIFGACCSNPFHGANVREEEHAEQMAHGVTKLRGILKKECTAMGVKNFWVLDSTGGVIGVPPGTSGGSTKETLADLHNVFAPDNVHFRPAGYKNLADAISASVSGLRTGTLTKNAEKNGNTPTGISGGPQQKKQQFHYWRGFSSPVGDILGRAQPAMAPGPTRRDRKDRGNGKGNGSSHWGNPPHSHPYRPQKPYTRRN
jgi:hypothetical protein